MKNVGNRSIAREVNRRLVESYDDLARWKAMLSVPRKQRHGKLSKPEVGSLILSATREILILECAKAGMNTPPGAILVDLWE